MPTNTTSSPTKRIGRPKKRGKYARWEHPEKSGIVVAEFPNTTRGDVFGVSYRVTVPASVTGRINLRERTNHKTKDAAFRHAEDRLLAYRKHGSSFSSMPSAMQKEAGVAWDMLKDKGLGFIEAVEFAVKRLRPEGGSRTVDDIIKDITASKKLRKEAGNLSVPTWRAWSCNSALISKQFGTRQVGEVTSDEVATWLRELSAKRPGKQRLASTTVFNYRRTLNQAFTYAVERGYCHENPVAKLTKEEVQAFGGRKSAAGKIVILKPEQANALLLAAVKHPELGMLPSVVLRLFCGLRTAEVCRLDWKAVRMTGKDPLVAVGATDSKTRSHGNVDLPTAALAWLNVAPVKEGPISPTADNPKHCVRFNKLRTFAAAESEMPELKPAKETRRAWSNITRHTFGSYHYAVSGDSGKTAAQMRHTSDAMLFAHYRALARPEDGERFFALSPNAPAKAGVVPLTGEKPQALAHA